MDYRIIIYERLECNMTSWIDHPNEGLIHRKFCNQKAKEIAQNIPLAYRDYTVVTAIDLGYLENHRLKYRISCMNCLTASSSHWNEALYNRHENVIAQVIPLRSYFTTELSSTPLPPTSLTTSSFFSHSQL